LIAAGPSGDLDSDLRVALLAMLGSGDRILAAGYLRKSADEKMKSVVPAEPTSTSGAASPLARWYTNLRSETGNALLAAEAQAIRAVAEALPKRLSDKFSRGVSTSRKQKGT
jgi:hypothetical protein